MAKAAIPYPDLPETPAADPTVTRAMFWHAAWLRAVAEHAALDQLLSRQYALKRRDHATEIALINALRRSDEDVQTTFKTLVGAGGLLFAWAPDVKGGAR
jgi:hypothetical protein